MTTMGLDGVSGGQVCADEEPASSGTVKLSTAELQVWVDAVLLFSWMLWVDEDVPWLLKPCWFPLVSSIMVRVLYASAWMGFLH